MNNRKRKRKRKKKEKRKKQKRKKKKEMSDESEKLQEALEDFRERVHPMRRWAASRSVSFRWWIL